jgi:serine protease
MLRPEPAAASADGVAHRAPEGGLAVQRFAWTILLMMAATAVAAGRGQGELNPVRHHPHGSPAAAPAVIIKLRQGSTALPAAAAHARLVTLATRAGLTLEGERAITDRLQVVRVATADKEGSLAEILVRLRADPEVQYAEPDQRRYVHSVPDDTLYSEQWYLMPSSAVTPSAIDAQSAWSITTGLAGLVIADIDTGVRFEHPDLLAVASGGRMLPGYCFISDPLVANNNTCPGADASDPGDWITSADLSQPECSSQTQTEYSSWHGTRVAGILGALTNNSLGIAGVTWNGQILPVRALGVCGGADSDIISGMLWAAGIAVSGVPANTTPARIINMSLGGTGACPQSYQDAIDQITALGVLIVVSAGNEGGPVDAPANCVGVAGVAGLRHAGTKVGYSSLGPEVALGAPAGNCVNTAANQPCVYTLTTTTNLATMSPGSDDYTGYYYCDPTTGSNTNCQISGSEYRTYNLGTSFAAPQVAGIGALMLAVNSKLNSCQLITRLQQGALPYPQSSVGETTQPPMCHVPAGASDVQDAECICTLDGQTCGAGMANASGALAQALRPIAAVAWPASVAAGQSVPLNGAGSAAATNHTLTAFAWSQVGGQAITIQNAGTATATVSLPACGLATVALTVTDDAGRQDSAQVVIGPTGLSSTAPATAGQAACSVSAPAVQVAVCPATAVLRTGATQALSATLANTTNTEVTWEVNGVPGGNASVGTVSSTGLYSAPASVPPGGMVTVTAVAAADSAASGAAQLTVNAAPGSGGGGGGGELDWLLLGGLAVALAVRRTRLPRALCGLKI